MRSPASNTVPNPVITFLPSVVILSKFVFALLLIVVFISSDKSTVTLPSVPVAFVTMFLPFSAPTTLNWIPPACDKVCSFVTPVLPPNFTVLFSCVDTAFNCATFTASLSCVPFAIPLICLLPSPRFKPSAVQLTVVPLPAIEVMPVNAFAKVTVTLLPAPAVVMFELPNTLNLMPPA